MESSRSRRAEKRNHDADEIDENEPPSKKSKLPALASVIVDALKMDSMKRFCSSLEPLLRRIVSEEVERALSKLGPAELSGRSSPPRIQGSEGKTLQLHFKTQMPPHLFTGGKVEGERGATIHVVLIDLTTGRVVQEGPESAAKLNVVVLEGDFSDDTDDNWTKERFESHEVKEREGKRPLLTGDLQVILKEGIGTLGDLIFTDNSSWIRSRKFRLGVKVGPGYCEGLRIREAKTESFTVKDHRGELYKKHYPPALHDEVWRLDRIAKDGALHKKLVTAKVLTVEDFLRNFVKDPQKLRNILGSGVSNRMWENTVEHAKTCVVDGKVYVYYTDNTHGTGAVFNHIYEFTGLIADGEYLCIEQLSHNQKVSVDSFVKGAYENWNQVVEYDGKVLSSLTRADHNLANDNYYMSSETSSGNQTENDTYSPQLIEFPFVTADLTTAMTLTTPQPYPSGDWSRPRNGHGLEDFISEDIRVRSSEMLDCDDMQRLLKTFGVGGGEGEGHFGHSNEGYYSYDDPYVPEMDRSFGPERGRSSGKAVVGWLKLKAALRWGIFVRKRAAERRAQLVELD